MGFYRVLKVDIGRYMQGFPKIGDPNLVPPNSRILIIRTPRKGTPFFRKVPYGQSIHSEPKEDGQAEF